MRKDFNLRPGQNLETCKVVSFLEFTFSSHWTVFMQVGASTSIYNMKLGNSMQTTRYRVWWGTIRKGILYFPENHWDLFICFVMFKVQTNQSFQGLTCLVNMVASRYSSDYPITFLSFPSIRHLARQFSEHSRSCYMLTGVVVFTSNLNCFTSSPRQSIVSLTVVPLIHILGFYTHLDI